MTAALQDATGLETPAHASDASGSTATPAADSQAQSNVSEEGDDTVSSDSRMQRFMDDPKWGYDQFKVMESKFGKANSERDQLKPLSELEAFVQEYGSVDSLKQNLSFFTSMLRDPNALEALKAYQSTGKFTASNTDSTDNDEEYLDDEQKRIRSLEAELQDLKSSMVGVGATQAKERFKAMYSSVFDKYPGMTEEHRAKVASHVNQTITRNSSTAEGLKSLDALDQQAVRALMLQALSDEELAEAVSNGMKIRSQANQAASTQSPGVTTAGEGRVGKHTAMQAFEEVCREEGVNPDDPFGLNRR